jgi:hypothetical protein
LKNNNTVTIELTREEIDHILQLMYDGTFLDIVGVKDYEIHLLAKMETAFIEAGGVLEEKELLDEKQR